MQVLYVQKAGVEGTYTGQTEHEGLELMVNPAWVSIRNLMWAGRRRGQEDEMIGWHHRLNGHEFEQVPGVGDGQGTLACCSPWVSKTQIRLSN